MRHIFWKRKRIGLVWTDHKAILSWQWTTGSIFSWDRMAVQTGEVAVITGAIYTDIDLHHSLHDLLTLFAFSSLTVYYLLYFALLKDSVVLSEVTIF